MLRGVNACVDGREEDTRTSSISRGHPPPVLESAEHDLDPVSTFVTALVILHRYLPRLPAWDAGAYPLVFQGFAEPVGIVTAIPEQPVDIRQTVAKRTRADVVADFPCGYEKVEGASMAVADGMELRVPFSDETVYWTVFSSNTLVRPIRRPRPPFLTPRLDAVRWAVIFRDVWRTFFMAQWPRLVLEAA